MSQTIDQQIENTMTKAFFDLLQENIKKVPIDTAWLLILFQEIRTKLSQLLRPTNKLYIEIEENMNDDLFKQMVQHNAFDVESFLGLVEFSFDICMKLGSPIRDKITVEKKNEIFEATKTTSDFTEIVPLYIKNIHMCIDTIYDDIRDLPKHYPQMAQGMSQGGGHGNN
jgi:hypothetical protein